MSSFIVSKNAGVRKASVLALQNLYEVDDNVPSLTLFTERFSNRMIELADDIDISVAVCGIGLVKQLLRYLLVILEVCFHFLIVSGDSLFQGCRITMLVLQASPSE